MLLSGRMTVAFVERLKHYLPSEGTRHFVCQSCRGWFSLECVGILVIEHIDVSIFVSIMLSSISFCEFRVSHSAQMPCIYCICLSLVDESLNGSYN